MKQPDRLSPLINPKFQLAGAISGCYNEPVLNVGDGRDMIDYVGLGFSSKAGRLSGSLPFTNQWTYTHCPCPGLAETSVAASELRYLAREFVSGAEYRILSP